jgi:hypothetical protein
MVTTYHFTDYSAMSQNVIIFVLNILRLLCNELRGLHLQVQVVRTVGWYSLILMKVGHILWLIFLNAVFPPWFISTITDLYL